MKVEISGDRNKHVKRQLCFLARSIFGLILCGHKSIALDPCSHNLEISI